MMLSSLQTHHRVHWTVCFDECRAAPDGRRPLGCWIAWLVGAQRIISIRQVSLVRFCMVARRQGQEGAVPSPGNVEEYFLLQKSPIYCRWESWDWEAHAVELHKATRTCQNSSCLRAIGLIAKFSGRCTAPPKILSQVGRGQPCPHPTPSWRAATCPCPRWYRRPNVS